VKSPLGKEKGGERKEGLGKGDPGEVGSWGAPAIRTDSRGRWELLEQGMEGTGRGRRYQEKRHSMARAIDLKKRGARRGTVKDDRV